MPFMKVFRNQALVLVGAPASRPRVWTERPRLETRGDSGKRCSVRIQPPPWHFRPVGSPRGPLPTSRKSEGGPLPTSRKSEGGPSSAREALVGVGVLNAFRHHGEGDRPSTHSSVSASLCSTPFGITARGTVPVATKRRCGLVLNAFRHHGEGDTRPQPHPRFGKSCSTPFGITARGTGARGLKGVTPLVLNAFRHHGEGDQALLELTGTLNTCSTPFGITARGTVQS